MTTAHRAPELAAEGIDIEPVPDGFEATAVRRDTTHITIRAQGFADEVSRQAEHGGFILVDRNVHDRWHHAFDLSADSYLIVEPGEHHKTLHQAAGLMDRLHERGIHRCQPLVGVGGGTTTDLVGLVASLYFRGVPAVYVPTTLLGMIDAAIGGKTGVNHPQQKNLIGTFSHPAAVAVRLDALHTVPDQHTFSALGEALKLAVADNESDLFHLLGQGVRLLDDPALLEHVVATCIATKLRLLGANAFERDLARVLNLGHTVAHPLEEITDYRIPHGTAVGIGVAVAAHISHQRDLLTEHDLHQILATLRKLSLPVMDLHFDRDELISRVQRLKLQRGGTSLHYVLPTAIGATTIVDEVHPAELHQAITHLAAYQQATS
ncbi:3-dehydroquinate synthase [Streptomyces sp. BE147]|uniref:3-dehydroquinate synthase n=1 Tax=Streptomyces sp. BE147 TaxID=3002524 RepID=UPI002E785AF5|nr:3-dehydroquinate synthase family protein [Streptomyces sp. BE147]MEE1736995.1 3-dehydroquinate synthase [Streptomyces sp. BE147]